MKPGSVIMLIFGAVLSLLGFSLALAGATTAVVSAQGEDGYLTSPARSFSVQSFALTSPRIGSIELQDVPANIGSLRLRAVSTSTADVFIGVAPQADVDRYLVGVNATELRDLNINPFQAVYHDTPGSRAPEAPGAQDFWVSSAEGPGTQEIDWDLTSGSWAVVVMNEDASPGVSVALQAGIRLGFLAPLAVGLLLVGLLILLIGLVLTVFGAIGLGRGTTPSTVPGATPDTPPGAATFVGAGPPGTTAAAAHTGERAFPARLTGTLDEGLSRWLWLVKWILIFPHVVVLLFLWFGFVVTTIVSGFAILFTGRYPTALFQFNVGVLRWSWRVSFYAYSALGTDRYPPFSLASSADYPADLQVDYPKRLSHGLVLVKWWLLAIPHLLVVAALTGSATIWRNDEGDSVSNAVPSLIGVLVLIAAVILLFTGRYRRSLFDLILGIDRWIFRVAVYTALFRDEYPPFRLDQGGADTPETAVAPAPIAPAAPAGGAASSTP
ncbi:DUF4389 domain-containing protein [Cryobacterium sp. TMT2-15-1]|uniref:DUF4389 domain-containing protein n=1 Tax=Cryobacterium sp. TMT2-15-1 TaxID=1259246 RepID=UPI00106CF597|nr:DUF4389 domain-containing protein [Cryobacterium sp. TMT2-15-1]TFC63675.1 DUF4389 domain-containing protein [Cryobacterium sp. TMT2-15-1]